MTNENEQKTHLTDTNAEHECRSGKRRILRECIEIMQDEAEDILYFSQHYGKEMLDLDLKLRDMSLDNIFGLLADIDTKGFICDNGELV